MTFSPAFSTTYDAYVASLGPVGWWPLNDAPGSTTAADKSGNGYTGTVGAGVTFGEPGPIANTPADTAGLFNGTSTSLVTTTLNPSGWAGISFAIWALLPTEGANATGVLVYNDETNNDHNGFYLPCNNIDTATPIIQFAIGNGTSIGTAGGGSFSIGGWHLFVGTWDGTTVRCFQDGQQSPNTNQLSGNVVAGSGPIQLGRYQLSTPTAFPGDIAQAAIFNYALTPTEIAALWELAQASPTFQSGGSATLAVPDHLAASDQWQIAGAPALAVPDKFSSTSASALGGTSSLEVITALQSACACVSGGSALWRDIDYFISTVACSLGGTPELTVADVLSASDAWEGSETALLQVLDELTAADAWESEWFAALIGQVTAGTVTLSQALVTILTLSTQPA